MPTIKVNTSRLSRYESDLQSILSRVNSIMGQFDSVSRNLDWDIRAESNINSRLNGISRELSAEASGISGMKNYLGNAVRKYNLVENTNSRNRLKNEVTGHGYTTGPYKGNKNTKKTRRNTPLNGGTYFWRNIDPKKFPPGTFPWSNKSFCSNSKKTSIGVSETALTLEFWSSLGSLWSEFTGGKWSFNLNNYNETESDKSFTRCLAGSISGGFKPGKYLKYGDKKAISDGINDTYKFLSDNDKNVIPKQKKIPIIQINPQESWYSSKGTIAEAKGELKLEGSVIDAKTSGEAKYAQGSAEAKLFTGEAHASVNAGLYVYDKSVDGKVKRIFSPGVAAEVGASVAAIDLIAQGRVGLGENNNMLGLYGKTEVKADSAEAKAKFAWNRKELYIGASAEADLVKAEASGGVSVLGTDIGVSGAVKVGVGAHAEAGVTDGKIKVDVGLAIGVGVDIGFEIDVSGTVDAVCDMASAAWDAVKRW